MRVVPIEEVVAFISGDKHTRVVTMRGELLLRRSLVELLKELDGDLFWPVSRGTVVHARFIDSVERGEGRDLSVRVNSLPHPIVVGRLFRDRFRGM